MIDFERIRDSVSALDAARYYGLEVNRNGKALCPFHNEKTPSMSFKDGFFHCFGCGASGDSIDYTARLLGLDATGAAKELNQAFSLGLPLDREVTATERREVRRKQEVSAAHKAFETWREGFITALNAAIREGNTLEITDLDKVTEREATALKMNATFEYWADLLQNGTPTDQAHIYREREVIAQWIGKVLNS